jgi:uncharacterized membrane protein
MANRTTMLRALGIGLAAGLRSMTAPAVISWAASNRQINVGRSPLALLGSDRASRITAKLALGEIVADKTPAIPSRLKPASLSWRLISGGVCGAAISVSAYEDPGSGAALGATGALIGSLLGYVVRTRAGKQLHVPDFPLALLEDAVAIGTAFAAVTLTERTSVPDAWADEDNPAWLP